MFPRGRCKVADTVPMGKVLRCGVCFGNDNDVVDGRMIVERSFDSGLIIARFAFGNEGG